MPESVSILSIKIKDISSASKNVKDIFQSYFDACHSLIFDFALLSVLLQRKQITNYHPDIRKELDATVRRGQIIRWGVPVYGEAYAKDASEMRLALSFVPFGV